MLSVLLAVITVMTAVMTVISHRTEKTLGSAMREMEEAKAAADANAIAAQGLEEELAELESQNLWAEELAERWKRETKEIEDIISS